LNEFLLIILLYNRIVAPRPFLSLPWWVMNLGQVFI